MPRNTAARTRALAALRRAQGAASDKIYRLEKQGIRIRGTEYDPRVAASSLGNLTTAQINAQVRKIEEFRNRGNQFVPGVGGNPIPRALFREYKAQEALYNDATRAIEASRLNRTLPGQDQTVGKMLEGRGDVQQRAFQQVNRQAKFFTGSNDVKNLIASLKEKNSPQYMTKALKPRLNSLYALLEGSGNADLKDVIAKMSKHEQLTLLDYSTFNSIAQERFSSGDDSEVSAEDAAYMARTGHSREVDIRADLERVIDWSRDTNVATRNSRKRKYTPRNGRKR